MKIQALLVAGSSPRVRGSQFLHSCAAGRMGIIPAGAGLTPAASLPGSPGRDHPRGCGAHQLHRQQCGLCAGSSPRVRGSPPNAPRMPLIHGIIPAGAGLTGCRTTDREDQWDHPRGCGAHFSMESQSSFNEGSSPRVRGSPARADRRPAPVGIIPAGAGLTSEVFKSLLLFRDHPRGCGAHAFFKQVGTFQQGSSPRVRGSPVGLRRFVVIPGIIPAGAGLTLAIVDWHAISWDHPRGCGAHRGKSPCERRKEGSSPRVRGSPAGA